jgi:hypothetical protein
LIALGEWRSVVEMLAAEPLRYRQENACTVSVVSKEAFGEVAAELLIISSELAVALAVTGQE